MTYLCASAWASTKAFFSSASFLRVAAHGLQILGLIGVVGRFHLGQRHLFGGVVRGADLAGALEGQVLEHVRQAALAGGVVHVAGVDKGGVAEDRRLRPLADDQRQPVGQHLGGDLSARSSSDPGPAHACTGHRRQHQQPTKLFQDQEKILLCILAPWRGAQTRCPALFQAIAPESGRQTGRPARPRLRRSGQAARSIPKTAPSGQLPYTNDCVSNGFRPAGRPISGGFSLASDRNSRAQSTIPHPLHHRHLRAPQRPGGDGRRRPGHLGRPRAQALGQKDSPPLSGQDSGRIRRFHRRRLLPFCALRDQAGAVRRQPEPRRRRAGQGLAHRQDAAQP